jgi:hypothetical protein
MILALSSRITLEASVETPAGFSGHSHKRYNPLPESTKSLLMVNVGSLLWEAPCLL